MRSSLRLLLIGVLTFSILGLGIHYDSTAERHWPYPSSDSLVSDYASHVGEKVFVFGTVRTTDGDRLEIVVSDGDETVTLGVLESTVSVRPGGTVQVVGELRPDRTVVATNVVVVNHSASSNWYKYGVSLVGAMVVLIAFFRQWRLDIESKSFEVK